jgi:arginine/lysine/histidine transporter system substrate-binding protein
MAAATHLIRWRVLTIVVIAIAIAALLILRATRPDEYMPTAVLRVGVDPSNPPFAFYEGDQLAGFEIELTRLLSEQLGLPVQFVALGFDGLYDAIKTDQVDVMLATLTPDPTRTAEVLYSSAYFDNGLVLLSDAGTPIDTMETLAGETLAYAYGSAAHAEADRWLRRIAPFAALPYELPTYALDAVHVGDAPAALVSAVDARVYRREHSDWDANVAYVTHMPYVAAVRIDRRRLLDAVQQAFAALESGGQLDELHERWL